MIGHLLTMTCDLLRRVTDQDESGGPSGGLYAITYGLPVAYQPRSSSPAYDAGRREGEIAGVCYFAADHGMQINDRLRFTDGRGRERFLEVVGVVDQLMLGGVVRVECREILPVG